MHVHKGYIVLWQHTLEQYKISSRKIHQSLEQYQNGQLGIKMVRMKLVELQ